MNSAYKHPPSSEIASPLVSVIIPTYNRKDDLQKLLEHLYSQTLSSSRYEIIVVDDGSTDDTASIIQEIIRQEKENLFFCYQKNQGPGAARNRGMSVARGELFAFTDTDCRPFPNWLDSLTASFSDNMTGAVGGAEECMPDAPLLIQAIHCCMTSSLTTGGMRGKSGKKLARYYPRTFNMAIAREAFNRTGGFKPLYHGEDIELSFRIREAGFLLRYNEQAKVFHRRRETTGEFIKQMMKMGEARVSLVRLHPELLEPLHVIPAAGLLIFVMAAACAPFLGSIASLLILMLFVGLGFCLLLSGAAFIRKRNIKLAGLVPVVFIMQQCAYGVGFYKGLWKWITSGDSAERIPSPRGEEGKGEE